MEQYAYLAVILIAVVCFLSTLKPIGFPTGTDWSQIGKCDSEAEKKLFKELAKSNIRIITQLPIENLRCDFYLPQYKTVIELDSYYHDNAKQQARDRRKDKLVAARGWKMIRVRCEWTIQQQMAKIWAELGEKEKQLR